MRLRNGYIWERGVRMDFEFFLRFFLLIGMMLLRSHDSLGWKYDNLEIPQEMLSWGLLEEYLIRYMPIDCLYGDLDGR